MKITRVRVFFVIAIIFTSMVFMTGGNMIGNAPDTASAGRLTTDMAGLCLLLFTDIGTGMVDTRGFENCCLQISSDN